MAQALFDALNGVGVDSQTALALHFLLGSQPGAPSTLSTNGVLAEDEDLFQCGKCKEQFSSFSEFFSHKKTHNSGQLQTVHSKPNEATGLTYSEIVAEQEFVQPITLTDTEFLSLSMDQGSLNISNTTQVLGGCEAYLSNSGQEPAAFQVPPTIPQEVTLSTNTEAISEEEMKKEMVDNSTITVSVVGAVQDQISGDVRSEEIQKEMDNTSGKVKCVYCGKSFAKNFDLQQHVRSHTGERPFQCVVCGRAFAQKSNVKKHMATHKVWPKRIRTLFIDPISVASKISSEENIASQTDNDLLSESTNNVIDDAISKSYICQYCPALFKNYVELKSHRKEHIHQKVYRCIQKNCNETFEDLDSFLGHTQIHENEAQYHCHVCSKEFKSLDELGTHQYSHSVPTNKVTPKIVFCKKCKSRFANQEGLDRHMVLESHSYPCPQCNKVFPGERFLRKHLVTHSTLLPYVCQHCSKAFKTENYLNMHIVIHSNEKPYTCQFCPAAFNRRDKLARHKLIHENSRKFKCPFSKHLNCTRAFNRKDKLKSHILTHSAKLRFLCENCGKFFQKQVQLKQHEKICLQIKSEGSSSSSKKVSKIRSNFDSSKNIIEVQGDNMSTIEIVVVPLTGEQNSNENNGTFRVTFPATKPNDPVDLSQTILTTPDQEVPVYKPK